MTWPGIEPLFPGLLAYGCVCMCARVCERVCVRVCMFYVCNVHSVIFLIYFLGNYKKYMKDNNFISLIKLSATSSICPHNQLHWPWTFFDEKQQSTCPAHKNMYLRWRTFYLFIFMLVMRMSLRKCCPHPSSFFVLIHADDLIKSLFISCVDWCFIRK